MPLEDGPAGTSSYDDRYAATDALFGTEPERTLQRFAGALPRGATLLDLGAGQGRNALFAARRGLRVHAVEPSRVAARALRDAAAREGLAIDVFETTFERFDAGDRRYAGILCFGLVPDLDWPAISSLVGNIARWCAPEALVWVTGFTTADPGFEERRKSGVPVGRNSFRAPDGRVRTYLESAEVLKLFRGYRLLHHWEGLGPEHRHGDGPPERHGWFEAVFTAPATAGGSGAEAR